MNKLQIWGKSAAAMLKKHSPEILTGLGIAGMLTGTVMAVKATPKALRLLEEKKKELDCEKLAPIEMVKTAWGCYIPAGMISAVSVGCLVGASSVNFRRNAALATAYALSESTLKDYQRKVAETIGERKEQAVRDEIAKEKIERHPVANREVILTGKGETLCYDVLSDRYFKSDIDKLRKAENELNRRMRDEMYISLNEFYSEIGLKNTPLGEELGWQIDDGYIDLRFSAQLAEDETPCLVLDYRVTPKYGYAHAM